MKMKRRFKIFEGIATVALVAVAFFTSCTDEELEYPGFDSGLYIGFSASVNETRSTVGRSNGDYLTIQEEEWILNGNTSGGATRAATLTSLEDLNVGIYAFAYETGKRDLVTDVLENVNYKFVDNENLRPLSDPVMWSTVTVDSLYAYGYAPYNAKNVTCSTTNGVTTLEYTVPADVKEQTDIIASDIEDVSALYKQSIPLTFEHILTGVRFKAGFDCTVTSLKLVNVLSKGEFVIGDAWKNQSTKASFTLPVPDDVCANGDYITDGDAILMMIPQRIPDDAYVEMKYTDGEGNDGTITASLKGYKWEKGSLITYVINKSKDVQNVYFDLYAGPVQITSRSYSGYVFVNGVAQNITKTFNVSEQSNYKYYVYQSTEANKASTGWETAVNTGSCRIPVYAPVMVGNKFWSDYITNNTSVEDVIETWDSEENINADKNNATVSSTKPVRAAGRSSTPYNITVTNTYLSVPVFYNGSMISDNAGKVFSRDKIECEITVDNIYSSYQLHGSSRLGGGLAFFPTEDYSKLVINVVGDNRVGNIHYYSGRNTKNNLLYNNELVLKGSGSMTVACVDFHKSTSAQSKDASKKGDNVYGYFSNYWCSAIGGDDSSYGNSIGFHMKSGTLFAGTTQAENCTAIGGGGNDRGYVTIEGGTVTAVAATTGTAIGGGIGFNSQGGIGNVTISGGTVYAYNHANEWEIPSAAIGSAGSWEAPGGAGTVEISGGYVYAEAALGTAIGGGSSKLRHGGSANVKITGNSYVIARSISAIDNYSGDLYPPGSGIGGGTGGTSTATVGVSTPSYGGSATINIFGNPTIRTGSIGGGKTNNPKGVIGSANITVEGGDISAQFIMAGGAGATSSFNMSGGVISNSDIESKEYYHASRNGGALYMEDGTFTMSGGIIRNCNADIGGAVYIKRSQNALKNPEFIMNNDDGGGTIENCVSKGHGGAIYLEGGDVNISSGTIQNNVACNGNGGGIYISAGNLSMPAGGDANVSMNSALGNSMLVGNGGGIFVTSLTSDVNVEVLSGSITKNACDNKGGGICVDMSGNESAAANVVVGDDDSTDDNPDISFNRAVLYGGGLYAVGKKAMVTINGGKIIDNSVANYVPNKNVTNERGTVVLNGGNVTHQVVTFDGNADDAVVNGGGNKAYQNIVTSTNSALVLPTVSRPLYNFVGWNSRKDGKGTTYTNGQTMNIKEDVTIYAIWVEQ